MSSQPLGVAGLFAGIGGLELGLQRAGHHCHLLCEIEPGASAVLRTRFPHVRLHADVTTLTRFPRGVDLVVGGFPCQDLSQAGLTKGLAGMQSSLVDHVFRLLRATEVPWVLLENVPFMLQLGQGNAIRHVIGELESLGYSWAYRVVDTRAFGLPQRRERVFILASKVGCPAADLLSQDEPGTAPVADAGAACGFFWTEGLRGLGWAVDAVPTLKGGSTIGIPSPPAIWLRGEGTFVTPDIRDAERLQGFPVDWTKPTVAVTRATHRWKLVGNAVSVPVAKWVAGRIGACADWRPTQPLPFGRRGGWPRAAFGARGEAWAVTVSASPVRHKAPPLRAFLKHPPKPLSRRALEGFRARLFSGTLRRPPEFDRDLVRAIAEADASEACAAVSASGPAQRRRGVLRQ